jgi:hypothetical protein
MPSTETVTGAAAAALMSPPARLVANSVEETSPAPRGTGTRAITLKSRLTFGVTGFGSGGVVVEM